MNQETKTIHLYRIIFASLSGLGIISVFLPWLAFDFYDFLGIQGDGWLALLAFIAVAVLSFIGQRSQGLSKGALIAVGVLGLISFSLPIYDWLIYLSGGGFEFLDDVELGFGAYLTILAGLGLMGLAVYCLATASKNQVPNLNFDTEKVSKVFSDGAQIIKAAGSAASQAVKKTVEEQKVNQQATAPTNGPVTPTGPTPAPASEPVAPVTDQVAHGPVSESVSPAPSTGPSPVQPATPAPDQASLAPEAQGGGVVPQSQGADDNQPVANDPWLSSSPVGASASTTAPSEPTETSQG